MGDKQLDIFFKKSIMARNFYMRKIKLVLFKKGTEKNRERVQLLNPRFVPMHIKEVDFELFLCEMEIKFPTCIKHIREIYFDRFSLLGPFKLATTEEKFLLVNEFLNKFGIPELSSLDADIAYHEGGDENFFKEKLEPIFTYLEPEIW